MNASLINTDPALQDHRLSQRQVRRSHRSHAQEQVVGGVLLPADFTFVCPTELGDLADNYAEFKRLARRSTLCRPTRTSPQGLA